ncbi:MAG: GMC oxidoreductase, partial [Holophagales bacterium]|nr:GMC oxidoreductase [Holophagales bacterium]
AGATMRPPEPGEQPDAQLVEWRDHRSGPYTTNGAAISIIRRSKAELPVPDLFIFGLVTDFRGYYPGYSARVRASRDEFTWVVLKGHTENTSGHVRIRSDDPRQTPAVNFKYFDPASDPQGKDLEAVVDGVELIREIIGGYRHLVAEELTPGKEVRTREQIRQYVRNEAWGHHASCTAKIGADDDPMAVLDGDFRVRGTRGLRVVDASVFPRIPGLFIVSAVLMVAEKASDVILRDARAGTRPPKPPLAPRNRGGNP